MENGCFRNKNGVLNARVHITDRRSILSTMKEMTASGLGGIKGEHVCIATDGWVDYIYLTVSFNNQQRLETRHILAELYRIVWHHDRERLGRGSAENVQEHFFWRLEPWPA